MAQDESWAASFGGREVAIAVLELVIRRAHGSDIAEHLHPIVELRYRRGWCSFNLTDGLINESGSMNVDRVRHTRTNPSRLRSGMPIWNHGYGTESIERQSCRPSETASPD
jgi:hypothetical protein